MEDKVGLHDRLLLGETDSGDVDNGPSTSGEPSGYQNSKHIYWEKHSEEEQENSVLSGWKQKLKKGGFGYVLFMFIGFMPFLIVNALFSELSLLEKRLPEGKQLGADIGFAFQVGNIGPIIYVYIQSKLARIDERYSTVVFSIVAIANAMLLAIFWDSTTTGTFGSGETSTGLFFLTFLSGVVGCTGVVVVFAFVSAYKEYLLPAVSAGLGGSGLLTAALSFMQGTGENPRFSVETFFVLCMLLLCGSLVSIFLLIFHKRIRMEYLRDPQEEELTEIVEDDENASPMHSVVDGNMDIDEDETTSVKLNEQARVKEVLRIVVLVLMASFTQACITYFIVPSFNTYVGHGNSHIVLFLSNAWLIANLIGRLFTSFIRIHRLGMLLLFQAGAGLVIVLGSLASSSSWFAHNGWLFVIDMVFFAMLSGFTNTMFYSVISSSEKLHEYAREHGDPDGVASRQMASRWVALINQVGATVGTFIAYGLVKGGAIHQH